MATNLETRLEKLECAQERATGRTFTDAERAVRLAWALEKGGPTADRLLAILAGADKRTNDHDHT